MENSPKIKVLGLNLGASTVSVAQIEQNRKGENPQIVKSTVQLHDGNPKDTLLSVLNHYDLESFDKIVATGRKFCNFVNLSSIPEPQAVEYAYQFVKPDGISCPGVVSAGGETFMVYQLDSSGKISNVLTGNKCASGTGEFFLQQLRRMKVSLKDAAQWAVEQEPYHVSGRCSVFCKSDCTHATNKGIPRSKVTAGLCKMMADKVLELLKKVKRENIMLTGGTALNQMMVEYLRRDIPGLIVPQQAPYFEALGAALWALENETAPFPGLSNLFLTEVATFDTLAPLGDFKGKVEFKTMETGEVRAGDNYILGLDVGSTTTKAVLLRTDDHAICASVYLRTNGDPVGASRQCYASILQQVESKTDPGEISITGLGVTGSGRQIAGLHALTDGVLNEIIAHASAAIYFDPDVDTLFEIGGQDAKYTYITNSVPSDYAMNEACSAGTGSFLEESALETLGVKMEDIAQIALVGKNPPNFNDQCAAFIASDIKNAIHEGVRHEDIVAGLVYSICMNYSNRVKGNRPVGEKVFMQGGVCYNKAVPLAMAALVGKPIIVPPMPGLMGAFGVALEVKKRIETSLMEQQSFDLKALADREVIYKKPFICKGGKQKCDRRCEIAVIEIEGKKYPFGGACNRYYNLRRDVNYSIERLDLVRIRQQLIFEKYAGKFIPQKETPCRGKIGINRSFVVNTYYPLYSTFFAELGFETVVPDHPSQEGIDLRNAAFCYPGELSHGFFYSLLTMKHPVDFIFLPHFKSIPAENGNTSSQVCPFVQGEAFYLQTTFSRELEELKGKGTKILMPLIDLQNGLEKAEKPLLETSAKMGIGRKTAKIAFEKALMQQTKCLAEMKEIGNKALAELETDPEKMAVVIFGRPYNGFVEEAHMGIPRKLASRGILCIPLDFLTFEDEKAKRHMYWGMGQIILKAARLVKRHPQLFGTYITNFSCGPDSFVIGYFRTIMGRKPSLTLELDSHTADAGLETRIEAFLDIICAYRQLEMRKLIPLTKHNFIPARIVLDNGTGKVMTSSGEALEIKDPRITVLLPSMGKIATELLTSVFRGMGINAKGHEPSDEKILKLGRGNTSCKECLPLILTTGIFLNYIQNKRKKDEILIYFMATGSGPCRFGQYSVFMEDLIQRLEIPDAALLSLTSENSYIGMENGFERKGFWAIIVSDVMEDIRSMILANATDIDAAMQTFNNELNLISNELERCNFSQLEKQLLKTADMLGRIPMKRPPSEVPVISLTGEIFVRRDSLSRQFLTERLAEKGFASVCSPVTEWVHYSDYLVGKELTDYQMTKMEKLGFFIRKKFMGKDEKRIKSALSRSGLVHSKPIDIGAIIKNGKRYISENLTGEAILTVGSSISEIAVDSCGVIAIGPFGCMPNRLSEAILNETMNREEKLKTDPKNQRLRSVLAETGALPFLAIESDGSPFPQLITAKLEAFCLRAERLHQRMLNNH
ncbi:MAG: acyl-CoA dehydratase activase [Thermodesulfobacteriota bacterium]|nr:acyl-CoA dehydratase activase [Thermodesulfobacteriota bacterium]